MHTDEHYNVDILVIDNYDSFVYNLVQYVGAVADSVQVRRNDAITLSDIDQLNPDGIVVSPGPGTPQDAGIIVDLFGAVSKPIFGVCLGHQALCAANGGKVGHAPAVVHGKPSTIVHDGNGLFDRLPDQLQVGRYHSLAVNRVDLPNSLIETASTVDTEREILMGVRHKSRPYYGVQFHPESILTGPADGTDERDLTVGHRMIANFCHIVANHG